MASYSTNEFRPGLKVLLEGDPCVMMEAEFVKPGKGQAFTRVKFRNLITGRVWERTLRSGESMEAADVVERDLDYLYTDGDLWYFMTTDDNYDQIAADSAAIGDAKDFLAEQARCQITFWNDNPISVTPPNFVNLAVTQTDPGVRGDTAQGGTKPATLDTGAVINVPLFIEIGDVLRVDTRTGEYVSRSKQ